MTCLILEQPWIVALGKMKGALGQGSEEQCALAVQLTSLSLITQRVTAADVALVGLEIQKSGPRNVTLC